MDLADLADHARVHNPHGRPIERVRLPLVPHLGDELATLGGQRHLACLEHRVRERLLAVNVLSQRHRRQ